VLHCKGVICEELLSSFEKVSTPWKNEQDDMGLLQKLKFWKRRAVSAKFNLISFHLFAFVDPSLVQKP
jgi:hypothetical protein